MRVSSPEVVDQSVQAPVAPAARARRQARPLVAVVGVLLILMGAAGGALIFLATGSTVEALAARVPVARGQMMSADMFSPVQIAPNQQLSYLEADELPALIGKRAAHDLAAGSLVGPEVAVESVVPAVGRTVVGVSVPPGAEPAVPLQVGDHVRVIMTEPAYACTSAVAPASDGNVAPECGKEIVVQGNVVASTRDEASGQVMVSVDVAEADAPRTAAAAAMGRVAVVLDSRER